MKVKFLPQNKEVEIGPNQSVLEVAHANGIPIKSTCNGMPSCAECRVKVVDGEFNLLPPSKKELNLIGTGYYIDQRRLSCQMHCFGDVTIDTTEHIEREAEGPITKKFLSRVQKSSAQESHSVSGVLIEQEENVLKELSSSVQPGSPNANVEASNPDFLGIERGGGGGGRGQRHEHRGGDRNRGQNQDARSGGDRNRGQNQETRGGRDGNRGQNQEGKGGDRPRNRHRGGRDRHRDRR